jgi:hypothetical protein
MAQHKISKPEGHYLEGDKLTVDNELEFLTTTNPEIDTTGGDFIFKAKTASATSWKLQDGTSGTDIINVDSTVGLEEVTLDADLTFAVTSNPELDTTGGSFIWKAQTANTTSWVLRDDTKGQDVMVLDTVNDTLTINAPYSLTTPTLSSPVIQKVFADSPYTASWGEDIEVDCTGGNVIINYPTAVGNNGGTVSVMRIDASANTITVEPNGAETLNGAANTTINSQWDVLLVKSNGTNLTWR